MAFYCFYQTDSKGPWHLALAGERPNLVKSKGAKLITALDVDNDFSTQLTIEEHFSVKQTGDLFFDFDDEPESCIEQFKKFLVVLQSKGVQLNQCRFYATGGRGFHAFLPMQMYMLKSAPNGVAGLVHIYKEMAHSLFVDSMDLRIYSAKKGRQLRCENVQRDNGKYKVQITPDEAFAMTVELYGQLCSSPRNTLPVEKPTFNPDLGLLYATAQDKVVKSLVKRKAKKPETDQLKKFKGEWPETLQLILKGLGLKEGVGWNYISFQLAVTASALGKTEEQLLEDAADLIENHVGDSGRYGSPKLRRRDLRDMFRYVHGSPCYEYSVGGIMALLMPEIKANADIAFGEWAPDPKAKKTKPAKPAAPVAEGGEPVEGGAAPAPEELEEEDDEEDVEDEDEVQQIRISRNGIFFRSDDGYRSVCDIGMLNPISMRKTNGEHIGYEVTAWLDGKSLGEKFIPMHAFTSKSQFNNHTTGMGASMRASDTQTSMLVDHFRKKSKDNPVYAVEREGIDLIPSPIDSKRIDIIWASPGKVVHNSNDVTYRYHGIYNNQGTYKSDLMEAEDLKPEDAWFVENLLKINTPGNLAKLLGWFSAAFMTQIIRRRFKRFPSLQLFGQAGAGKSMTIILMNHMHYHRVEPRQFAVAGQTMFPLIVAVATSASIPLVFEELKSRELSKTSRDFLRNLLRSNYTADQLQRGSLGRDKAVREPTVTDFSNAAPICFVGEAIEDQSAILERCVVVALSKSNQRGREQAFANCIDSPQIMGKIGKRVARKVMSGDPKLITEGLQKNFKQVTGLAEAAMIDGASRPAFNLAVVLSGLDLLESTLSEVFGDQFSERFDAMRDAITNNIHDNIPKNMSEASRVLDTMSLLSRNPDPTYALIPKVDYTINADGKTMDIKLRTAYAKYVRYQRSLGMEVLFDTENAFLNGMANYGGTVQKTSLSNVDLYDSPSAVIYKFDLEYMRKEGVDSFK